MGFFSSVGPRHFRGSRLPWPNESINWPCDCDLFSNPLILLVSCAYND